MPSSCEDPLFHGIAMQSSGNEQLPVQAACERTKFARPAYPSDATVARTAIVLFVSNAAVLARFSDSGNFLTWDEYLLGPQEVAVIFYPAEMAALRSNLATSLSLQLCKTTRPAGKVAKNCESWTTGRGNSLLTCAAAVDVPASYGHNLTGARQTHLPTFCGVGTTGEYVVATKWYTLPMLAEPILRTFDYWAKIDVDVCFRTSMKLTHTLVKSGSWFVHTRLQQDNEACERSLGQFMSQYTKDHGCCATPEALLWRESSPHLPQAVYANFVAGWLGFWQSDQLLYFARQWHAWEGGWRYRWTDQQFWMPALRVTNVSEERITFLPNLRYRVFEHTKAAGYCLAPRPRRNASAPRKVLSASGHWVLPASR